MNKADRIIKELEKKYEQSLKNAKEIEDEFYRIAHILAHQGDIDVLCDLIQLDTKKIFIKDWKSEE